MRIGFIGFGEAASAIATGLRESGVDQVYAYDAYRSDALQHRVQQASAILVDSLQELADLSELVLSLVTAKSALPVAREFATYVTHDVVYADLNSCSPKTKQQIAEVFGQGKVKFASVAVMSAVPPLRHKVPMLSDGPGADDFAAQLMPFGMNIEVVNGEIGSAAGIKMCRSVIIKGMEALFLEALLAADQLGVAEQVLESADASFRNMTISELANYLITRNMMHGERRAHELLEAADMVADLGLEPMATLGAAQRLTWSASLGANTRFEGRLPESYQSVIAALRASSAQ